MQLIRKIAVPFGFVLGLIGSPAAADTITFSTTGFGPLTWFPGVQQETHFNFTGGGGPVNLTQNVSLDVWTNGVGWPLVGVNDGSFNGPDETKQISTLFTVGAQSVTFVQNVRYRQIANEQFMLEVFASPTQTLDLGAQGLLDITPKYMAVQLRPLNSGGGGALLSTFRLHTVPAAVPEPGGLTLAVGAVTVLGLLLQRRRSAR
jgi:hypothetical protein